MDQPQIRDRNSMGPMSGECGDTQLTPEGSPFAGLPDALPTDQSPRTWTTEDSAKLYRIQQWGAPYFSVNEGGHVQVQVQRVTEGNADLFEVVQDLRERGIQPPFMLHFPDILAARIAQLQGAFEQAIERYRYPGCYQGVFPLKCKPHSQWVANVVRLGRCYGMGLEVGSKPELLVAIATLPPTQGLLICNGVKDAQYIETALLAMQLGHRIILVLEKLDEVALVLSVSQQLQITPILGIRSQLSLKGTGHWGESAGERAKFGLTIPEILDAVALLQQAHQLNTLQLLHFHTGSQISAISVIKDALREACQIYVELAHLGAPMGYLDVGGGLGIDYDGSKSNTPTSTNYTLQNYANDIVAEVKEACDAAAVQVPTLISESGRALASHQAVLICEVLGSRDVTMRDPQPATMDDNLILRNLYDTYQTMEPQNCQEAYHDAVQFKQEANSLFSLGYLTLQERGQAEQLYWACCAKALAISRAQPEPPDDLDNLENTMASTYQVNVSIFQSLPDTWAVQQHFPIMPIHRLDQAPTQRATLADLTCDSDGKIDQFIQGRCTKPLLELHPLTAHQPYYLGIFLCGAYQDTLGSLHNLFGTTPAIHLHLTAAGYQIEHIVPGQTVCDVVAAAHYDDQTLVNALRRQVEQAVHNQHLSRIAAQQLMHTYAQTLSRSPYLAPPWQSMTSTDPSQTKDPPLS